MDTILLTEVQLLQRTTHPGRVRRHLEVGDVDITIQQAPLIERTFLSM